MLRLMKVTKESLAGRIYECYLVCFVVSVGCQLRFGFSQNILVHLHKGAGDVGLGVGMEEGK